MTESATPERAAAADSYMFLEMRRRAALRAIFGAGVAAALGADAAFAGVAAPQFLHGVASGDPLSDRVVIWTRVTPAALAPVTVRWAVATDPGMGHIVARGDVVTNQDVDFTVKVDVTGLKPATRYHYAFAVGDVRSPIGRTNTLPAATSTAPFSLAVFSCSIFEKGYFHAYADAAKRPGLGAVVHLGDYNYEYGVGRYITPALLSGLVTEPRSGELQPTTDTVFLDAYRTRKALYHTDADLQKLHAALPWITVWDDHESADNAWTGGAANHDPATQGDWQARKAAAVQAYYEWLPIREPADGNRIDPVTGNPAHMYRSFDIGKVARLVMLDTRMAGRDQQLDTTTFLTVYGTAAVTGNFDSDALPGGGSRSLMGAAQEAWFDEQMSTSTQTWQLIGSQVLARYDVTPNFLDASTLTPTDKATISAVIDAQFGPGVGALFGQLGQQGAPNPATADAWNGYPAARGRFYGSMLKAANPVVLSGDSHNAWAANLAAPTAVGLLKVAVEFGGTSVTSPGYEESFPGVDPKKLADVVVSSQQAASPGDKITWADLSHRGYMVVHVSMQRVTTEYVLFDSVFNPAGYAKGTKVFTVQAGAREIANSGLG